MDEYNKVLAESMNKKQLLLKKDIVFLENYLDLIYKEIKEIKEKLHDREKERDVVRNTRPQTEKGKQKGQAKGDKN